MKQNISTFAWTKPEDFYKKRLPFPFYALYLNV